MKENSSHYAVFRRLLQAGSLAALLGLPVFVMAQSQGAGDEESLVDAFVQSMQEASGGAATIERSPQTGLAIVAALPDVLR